MSPPRAWTTDPIRGRRPFPARTASRERSAGRRSQFRGPVMASLTRSAPQSGRAHHEPGAAMRAPRRRRPSHRRGMRFDPRSGCRAPIPTPAVVDGPNPRGGRRHQRIDRSPRNGRRRVGPRIGATEPGGEGRSIQQIGFRGRRGEPHRPDGEPASRTDRSSRSSTEARDRQGPPGPSGEASSDPVGIRSRLTPRSARGASGPPRPRTAHTTRSPRRGSTARTASRRRYTSRWSRSSPRPSEPNHRAVPW